MAVCSRSPWRLFVVGALIGILTSSASANKAIEVVFPSKVNDKGQVVNPTNGEIIFSPIGVNGGGGGGGGGGGDDSSGGTGDSSGNDGAGGGEAAQGTPPDQAGQDGQGESQSADGASGSPSPDGQSGDQSDAEGGGSVGTGAGAGSGAAGTTSPPTSTPETDEGGGGGEPIVTSTNAGGSTQPPASEGAGPTEVPSSSPTSEDASPAAEQDGKDGEGDSSEDEDDSAAAGAAAAGAAGAAGAAAAAGAFGSRTRSAPLGKSPTPGDGNIVNRFPVTVKTEGDVFSENMDKCVRNLVADETDTDADDWHLISADKTPGKSKSFDVAYDAEIPEDEEDEIRRRVDKYVKEGRLDDDIDSKCKEDATVTSRGSPTRTGAGGNDLDGASNGRRVLPIVLGITGALGALALLGALGYGAARRKGSSTSDDDAYSRSVFPTSTADADIEAGRVNVEDPPVRPESELHRPDAEVAAPEVDAPTRPAVISTRDDAGNFVMDREPAAPVDSHPHDYLIGEGPVTSATPHPPQDYVVRDSGVSGSSDQYSSMRDSTGTDGYRGSGQIS